MKKSVIAFAVAFVLSAGFTFLSLLTQATVLNSAAFDATSGLQVSTLINVFLGLAGLALFFTVFYFLARKSKILAVRSTTLALLLGVLLGSAILYLYSIATYPTYLLLYLSLIAGSLLSSVFQYFLPALTAILFAELKEKKSNNNSTQKTDDQNPTEQQINFSAPTVSSI